MHFVFENIKNGDFSNFEKHNKPGIVRFSQSSFANTILRFKSMESEEFEKFVEFVTYSDLTPKNKKYIIPVGVSYHPSEWCGSDRYDVGFNRKDPNLKSLFQIISPQYLKDLQEGQAFLLLDQSHEGYQTEWLWQWFHNNCDEFNINPTQIIYVTGNLNCRTQYTEWADSHNLKNRIFPVPYPHFEMMMFETMKIQNEDQNLKKTPEFEDQLVYKEQKLFDIKTFNALQKRFRAHRIWFFKYLHDANLINDNIISMNEFNHIQSFYDGRYLNIDEWTDLSRFIPRLPPQNPEGCDLDDFSNQDCGKYLNQLNEQIMLDTWLTVVSEASFGDHELTCFLSEKTFKPIACYHPFIIFGNKGSLEHIRNLGYKTFHPFIDETYDTLPTWERIDAITKELIRINNFKPDEKLDWYKNLKNILEHNYNILHINSRKKIPSAFVGVSDYVSKTDL